jgi:hypothetical protein
MRYRYAPGTEIPRRSDWSCQHLLVTLVLPWTLMYCITLRLLVCDATIDREPDTQRGPGAGGRGSVPDGDGHGGAMRASGGVALNAALLSDRPLNNAGEDRLGFDAYANALAGIIGDASTDTPLTIAISAAWGAGKTSLAKMTEAKLLDPVVFPRRQNVTCWFNAWMHDDAPNLGTAFAAKVARDIDKYRPLWRRVLSPLPTAFYSPQERWRRRVAMAIGCVLVVALAALLPGIRIFMRELSSGSEITSQLDGALSAKWASGAALIVAVFTAARRVFAAAQAAAQFVDDPQAEAAKGSMQSVHDQLADLIKQATRRRRLAIRRDLNDSRLIIFVDDLERCRPPRAVDVCEIANQLLSVQGVVTVLLGDMQAIAASAAMKYLPSGPADAPGGAAAAVPHSTMSPFAYGRAYLEKIIQIQFSVPVSGHAAIARVLTSAGDISPDDEQADDANDSAATEPEPPVAANGVVPTTQAADPETAPIQETPPGRDPESTARFIRRIKRLRRLSTALGFAMVSVLAGVWLLLLHVTSIAGWEAGLSGLGAAFVVAYFGGQVDARIERLTGHKESELDDYIQEISAKAGSVQELRTTVEQSEAAQNLPAALVSQRIQSFVVEESPIRQKAEATVVAYAPTLPRGAKRMINQLRLAIAVADRRHMFDSGSPLQAEQLGKWVVLVERWPELAARLAAQPQEVTGLEKLTRAQLKRKAAEWVADTDDLEGLCDLLKSPHPLAPVLENLVRYEQWTDSTTAPVKGHPRGSGQRAASTARHRGVPKPSSPPQDDVAEPAAPELAGVGGSFEQSEPGLTAGLEQIAD